MNILKSPKSFQEDFTDENGMYDHHCLVCGCEFYGHKYRKVCKPCANQIDHRTQHQKDKEKEIYDRWYKYRMPYLLRDFRK